MTGERLDDARRLDALRESGLLDSPADEGFDRLTRLATRVLGVPVALVTLVDTDRQFFKSCVGLPEPWASKRETPLSHSFCQHTITTGEPLVVNDAREHAELRHNLAIRDLSVIAYAGIPLRGVGGHLIGTFCAIDGKPRQWSAADIDTLSDLAAAAATEIELRGALEKARESSEELRIVAESSRVLGASLELEETLQAIARVALPYLGDMAMVDVLENGVIRRVAASVAGLPEGDLLERARAFPPHLGDGGPQDQAISRRERVLIDTPDEHWAARAARSDEHRALIQQMHLGAVLTVPLNHDGGDPLGAITFARVRGREPFADTDLHLADEIARRATLALEKARLYQTAREATKARDDMLGVVSHDLRNPIHTIFMSASFMLELLDAENPARTQASVIRRASLRANRLIQDLLDVTRLESGRAELDVRPTEAATIIEETIQQASAAAGEAGIALVQRPIPPVKLKADSGRLVQALGNIVANAIKFTPAGGTVTISAERRDGAVAFEVEDTGSGIAPEHVPRLFDRFWQANRKDRRGVGLGLSIVKGIADAHGGEVKVESHPGRGSTFRLEIPAE